MSGAEILSMAASIASLVLAIVAISLAIVFFQMSSRLAERTKEAAKGIGASVDRLENLFDKLYSDTFSMMRDTYSDMRKHIWPEEPIEADKLTEEVERKADEKVNQLKQSIDLDLERVLHHQQIQDIQVNELRREMEELIERAIVSSREVESEAREETLREYIIAAITVLDHSVDPLTASTLLEYIEAPGERVVSELRRMMKEDLIRISDTKLKPSTKIELIRPNRIPENPPALPEN